MDYDVEIKIGSEDDMLSNATKHEDKTLTLKSLEKNMNIKFKDLVEKINSLESKINIIKKSLKR